MSAVMRKAPEGFTQEQWETFERDGFLAIPDAIGGDDVQRYLGAAEELRRRNPAYDPAHAFRLANVLPEHPDLEDLIDNDRHIGYAYDLYGDQTKCVQSDIFIRPTQGIINHWHVDGPRSLPFRVFSPTLPLKLRVGYWLTGVPEREMGNYIYIPGSHKPDYDAYHSGINDVEGQQLLCGRAGTMTIAHANLWHRIDANYSTQTRATIFLTYSPSWIASYYPYPADWVNRLTRDRKVLMRAYEDGESFIRPPAEDLPLFADGAGVQVDTETDFHKLRRPTRYELNLA
ncbi:MAG: phytanoyl-CoA dioxygenase family protein [Actinomycetota bacterium]|nr:phytanoyl-CoA dioxygenase family protein [Actinomycetota bacterium]